MRRLVRAPKVRGGVKNAVFCVTDRSKSVVVFWCIKNFLCCWRLMYVSIFLVKLR